MTKLLLCAGLAASLLVPAGGVAVVVIAATSAPATRSPDELRPATEFDKDQIVAIRNELVELDRRATPGSSAQILEARRIAREARTWAVRFEAEPEWEELALATSALAAVIADGIEHPAAFSPRAYDRAVARLRAADEALPDDWHS
jgi:hypothetical protein